MNDVHSLLPTNDSERTASAGGVALIWLAATMTASTLPLGALLVELFPSANFLVVLVLASVFFITVGAISLPGFNLGIPTMAVSSRLYGDKFNRLVSFSNWLSQVGWQAIVLVLVIYVLRSMLSYLGLVNGSNALGVAIILGIFANFFIPIIGYQAIVKAQSIVSIFMGIFALYILIKMHGFAQLWERSFNQTSISWIQTFSALSLALMGGALSWTMFASDYSRYLNRTSNRLAILIWPTLGGGIGSALILSLALVLTFTGGVNLSAGGLEITAAGMHSPIIYLSFCVFAILGLLASNFLNSYSSAFSLAVTLNRDLNRKYVTVIDAILATLVAIYILFVSPSFFDSFQTFLDLLIIIAAPWTGIMCSAIIFRDLLTPTCKKAQYGRVTILLIGVFATILFSNNPLWEGWGAMLLANNDISPLVGFIIGLFLESARRIAFNIGRDKRARESVPAPVMIDHI